MKWCALLSLLVVLAGCRTQRGETTPPWSPPKTAAEFDFLRVGLPTTVVFSRVGMPDWVLKGGAEDQLRWWYDLTDGSQMVIFGVRTNYPDHPDWEVVAFGQQRGTNWLWIKPENYK
jgi:hypothetical protein